MIRHVATAAFLASFLPGLALAQMDGAESPKFPLPVPVPRPFPTKAELERFFESSKPTPIPDNPPPHEGALIDQPYIVEPPDILIVEVLEGLPGRPISGERLVRPDGTIDLGFYGRVHVRGLTLAQVKVAIILRLREYLEDNTLGLYRSMDVPGPSRPEVKAPAEKRGEEPPPAEGETLPGRPTSRIDRGRIQGRAKLAGLRAEAQPEALVEPEEEAPPPHKIVTVHPADSDRVLVDVASYNSKVYFVLGDFASPGRMPITGRETVIDAIQHAGGFLPTSDLRSLVLVRPGVAGQPAKTYPIDYEAIVLKGERQLNYQVFAGDRIVIGRNALDRATIEIDRLAKSQQTVIQQMMTTTYLWRSLASPTLGSGPGITLSPGGLRITLGEGRGGVEQPAPLTQEQQDSLIKGWVELWSKIAAAPNGFSFDEKAYRETLLRQLQRPKTGPAEK